jgi:phosphate transport system substrate-binding protein
VNDCYRLIKPLRSLQHRHHTEVFEVDDGGTPKVLKILQADDESLKLVDLFKQEVKVLIHLEHPGIPKAELDSYFKIILPNGQTLRCLAMEKIDGVNLEDWINKNGLASQEQGIDWLKQISEILLKVHQNNFFHRDIKPSNIMIKPSGQLILIDFGTARELTETVIEGKNVTVVYSRGYTAPEQLEGSATPQSDFYALGRTFVHLITGEYPDNLQRNPETGLLMWRHHIPQISKQLADLLDEMMALSPKQRPKDAQIIIQRLEKIEEEEKKKKKSKQKKEEIKIQQKSQHKLLKIGLIAGTGIILTGAIVFSFFPRSSPASLCFRDIKDVPKGNFNYGGSTSWAPIRLKIDSVIQKLFPDFSLRYENPTADEGTPGSTTGIKMLLKERLTFAQSSRTFSTKEQKEGEEQGFSLRQQPVALDGVAIGVNPEIKISGLTKDQLRDIYLGKIRNWKELGGADIPITPYTRLKNEGGTVDWFIDTILKNQLFGDNVKEVADTTQAIQKLFQDKGGIYYASAPEIVEQCRIRTLPIGDNNQKFIAPYKEPWINFPSCLQQKNQVNNEVIRKGEYPLTRNLFVIFKDYPGSDNLQEKAGKAYTEMLLTTQGQELLENRGFVKIRASDKKCTQ